MGDVTITRGIGAREDFLTTTQLSQTNSNAPPHVTITSTTDGDVQTLNAVFNSSAVTNDNAFSDYNPVTPPSTTTYPNVIIRHKEDFTSTDTATLDIIYGDATSSGFPLTLSTTFITQTFTLNPGKTVLSFRFKIIRGSSGAVTRNYYADFAMTFKETLTLPAITQPMPVSAGRIVAVLPILGREGEILQDLGSKSPELVIQGALVSTTTPSNHTAAEWWDILEGLVLEGANETWQWVTSDRVKYKYLPLDLSRSEILANKNYYEFTLRLKRYDVLSQITDRLGIIY